MKYRIQFLNQNTARIHVDQRLLIRNELHFDVANSAECTDEQFEREAFDSGRLKSFCAAVSEIEGIPGEIYFGRYFIVITKASEMFSWGDILPYVIFALRDFVAHDGAASGFLPTSFPSKKELQATRSRR